MKKTLLSAAALILTIVTLSSCHFSVGTKKDLNTGLSASYNGFSVSDIYLANKAGEHLTSNKVVMNSTFYVVATDVGNYTLKDGKAYPGCEITVTDKAGKTLGHIDDAMAGIASNGLDPAKATTLSANITLSPPFVVGQPYHVSVRFFDKQNVKNKINADVEVVLQ